MTHDLSEHTHAVSIARVQFEHLREPLGVGTATPRISWVVDAAAPGWSQAGYELASFGPGGEPRDQPARAESGESALVAWPFAPLRPRERVAVRVRAWGQDGQPTPWSAPAAVEAGLLRPEDWDAQFIAAPWDEDTSQPQPAPMLRRAFAVRAGVARARLYITALGVYEASINGAAVGDHVLAPGWTSYGERVLYQSFDIAPLLREGQNAIGALLGDGWYRGRLGFGGGRRNCYGERLALLAQIEIDYADGSAERIVTDGAWKAASGPILSSDIYDGETYDARLEQPGWDSPGFDDSGWQPAAPLARDLAALEAPLGPPVRRTQLVEPARIFTSPSGKTLVDFGQNLVGRLRIRPEGQAGRTITLRHAEVLEHGELATRPLRVAEATDRYTLRGGGPEEWEPRFTFHGFRYAEVEGWPGELRPDQICAVVCHSDMERTGWFACSDPLLNRLHENVVWSMRGNFLSIPTDCPQRDERLGWTGDIQVFAPTASFLYDCAGFLGSWLRDLEIDQRAMGGVVPFTVPNVLPQDSPWGPQPPAAAWGDAAAIVPWVLYQRFGDAGVLAQQFESMRAWVDTIAAAAGERRLWDTGFQFGDWLDPAAPPERPAEARTAPAIVATAYLARSAEVVGRSAQVLGRAEDAERYLGLAAEVRQAFAAAYAAPDGHMSSDAATAYALALAFGLLPSAEQRQRAGQRLAALVREEGHRIGTGFVGTPLVCDALCEAGALEDAYALLMQRENPSWLYPVTMGATTIWERWDSMLPDGSINPGEMTSFNHYALGAVADWLHRTVAGLAPDAPGYRRIRIQPLPGGGLTSASARHATPYGMAACSWQLAGGTLTVEATVPPSTAATVALPGGQPFEVGPGQHRWQVAYEEDD
ncbi:Bacterial alpha-L-rhamnosidase [Chloroflexia bacterium SDU3-3]|nr:Bacterial alpha-L-rhamnosidase [Chloroflexia bacterium SDU3-3]